MWQCLHHKDVTVSTSTEQWQCEHPQRSDTICLHPLRSDRDVYIHWEVTEMSTSTEKWQTCLHPLSGDRHLYIHWEVTHWQTASQSTQNRQLAYIPTSPLSNWNGLLVYRHSRHTRWNTRFTVLWVPTTRMNLESQCTGQNSLPGKTTFKPHQEKKFFVLLVPTTQLHLQTEVSCENNSSSFFSFFLLHPILVEAGWTWFIINMAASDSPSTPSVTLVGQMDSGEKHTTYNVDTLPFQKTI